MTAGQASQFQMIRAAHTVTGNSAYMLLAAATILLGFIVLIWSADLFVDGAASIAENMGMSPIIIGLTIVSLGTSAPEVLVSHQRLPVRDQASLAVGNAIGSNIANIGLVLGVTLLDCPAGSAPPLYEERSCLYCWSATAGVCRSWFWMANSVRCLTAG